MIAEAPDRNFSGTTEQRHCKDRVAAVSTTGSAQPVRITPARQTPTYKSRQAPALSPASLASFASCSSSRFRSIIRAVQMEIS